ncbi:MAG: hypothetical protein EOO77_07635, partial [Oxalobacteraceae bacterium]
MLTFTPHTVRHIDGILPHIADKPEIGHSIKDGYQVLDYNFATATTFDNWQARECRGIKFDLMGNIIARPYQKFFNALEKEETQLAELDFAAPHVLLEKLDGSMVHSILVDGRLRLMTRKGLSDVALKAEQFLNREMEAGGGLARLFEQTGYTVTDYTFIFEYVAPHNQIVVFYEDERLILTGMREIVSGRYVPYEAMCALAEAVGVPVVQPYCETFSMEEVRADVDREGLVIRWRDGAMAKVKADLYCLRHGAVDSVSHAHGVIELAMAKTLDDVLPNLSGEFLDRVTAYHDAFFAAVAERRRWLISTVEALDHLDQKAFAAL